MAGSSLGFRHGPKTKQKISEAHKGKELTPETKQKISEAFSGDKNVNFGKFLTPETKTKISEAQKGKSASPETRAKINGSLGTQIYVYGTQGSRR
jgi:Spy/CpxP family protein refolding chaperone